MRFGRLARMLAAAAPRSACSDVTNDPSHSPIAAFVGLSLVSAYRDTSGRLAPCDIQLRDDLFLHVAQTVLAKEDLVADEEGRRTKGAASHRVAGVLDQLLLDVLLLCARNETVDVDA